MAYGVAVDAGGTTTRCTIVESGGRCLGFAKTGSGNPVSAGVGVAVASFVAAIEQALRQGGVSGPDVGAVVFSMAGGITTNQMDAFVACLRQTGIERQPVVKSDLLGSFCSGTPELDGYVLVAGTGAGAARIVGGEIAAVADSTGWLIGDNGSGFWIGRRVVQAVLDDLDGRGPSTALTARLLTDIAPSLDQRLVRETALRAVYAMRPVELSRFAPLAFEANDEVSRTIVADAAIELAQTLGAVADPVMPGPVVLAGGVLSANARFAAAVQALAKTVPATRFIPVADGAVGAAVLALRQLDEPVGRDVFETIVETLRGLSG